MRKFHSLAGVVLVAGCMDSAASTTAPRLPGAVVTGASVDRQGFGSEHGEQRLVLTLLSGDEENPPRATDAHGQAHVRLSADGMSMDFQLVVNDITNVTMAHIHVAPKGSNGPIVVWFFPAVTATQPLPGGGGLHNGLLAKGSFTAADLRGPLAGQPLSALVAAIAAGNAYVNVHTEDGLPGANTGPGDFPGGEIRGQLDRNGH